MGLCYFLKHQLPEDALHCTAVPLLCTVTAITNFVGSQQAHSEVSASPVTTSGREGWIRKKKHVLAIQFTDLVDVPND